jgi:hypothetical protein
MNQTTAMQFRTGDLVAVTQDFKSIMNGEFLPLYACDPWQLMLDDLRGNNVRQRMPDVVKKLDYGDTAVVIVPGDNQFACVLADGSFGWVMKSMIGKFDAYDR